MLDGFIESHSALECAVGSSGAAITEGEHGAVNFT